MKIGMTQSCRLDLHDHFALLWSGDFDFANLHFFVGAESDSGLALHIILSHLS
jgi:hypothetical protein